MFKRKNKSRYIAMCKYSNFLYTLTILADKKSLDYSLILRDIRFNNNKFIVLDKSLSFEKINLSFYKFKDLLNEINLKILKINEEKEYFRLDIDLNSHCRKYLIKELSRELDILNDVIKSKKYSNVEIELDIKKIKSTINDFLYEIKDIDLTTKESVDLVSNIINFIEEDCLLLNLLINMSE